MVILGFDFGLSWTDGSASQAVVPNKFPLYFTPNTRFSSGAEWGVSMSEFAGVYYGTLANLLNDYEGVEVDVILPATEARAFKFDRLVYIESVGHIFVEEISGWAPGLIATLRGVIVP
jgi:hypothetical protein